MNNYNELGLFLYTDFINEQEEKNILKNITKTERKQTKLRNDTKRYGSEKPYNNNMCGKVIPAFLETICNKIVEHRLMEKPNSVSVNEYQENQLILPHIDSKRSGEVIIILSLLSEATMVFTLKEKEFSILFPPRCLIVMKNDIRNLWKHSILPVKSLRYSIVFRKA